jgi:insertion element IS1 protein InsB
LGQGTGSKVYLPKKKEGVAFMESDEMHTYVGSKENYCRIRIAVDRLGKRFISFVSGDRSTETGVKLWEEIKDIPVSFYYWDYRKSYEAFIPEDKHLQTKAETFTVESYNSRI